MSIENDPDSDERLIAWLADYADALGRGDGQLPDKSGLPAALWSRVDRALAGLQLLRQLRPALGSTSPDLADSSLAKLPADSSFTNPILARTLNDKSRELPWSNLGRFQIRRELGRGSFGIVYLAFDPQLNREVALKVPRAEAAVTPELRQRFQREARAASALDHPNLVPVYEVVATVAEAVQHAHSRGVLHRDLKPSNILLQKKYEISKTDFKSVRHSEKKETTSGVGRISNPSHFRISDFEPKITDFGLAKYLTSETLNAQGADVHHPGDEATRTGAILGTPSYMAPEQVGGKARQIGPGADVYALGAILYELITGRPPFRGDSDWDTLLQLQGEEPVSPGRLRSRLPRDLETICLKCLEKEPSRRYPSASELAADLHRYLKGKPIQARPVSSAERVWRWCRRNPLPSSLAGVAVLLLMLVAAVASVGYVQTKGALNREALAASDAKTQRQVAVEERDAAQLHLYYANMHLAQQAWKEGEIGQLTRLLDQYRPQESKSEIRNPKSAIEENWADSDLGFRISNFGDRDLRGWEWRYLQSRCQGFHCLRGHRGRVRCVAWSPDGRFLASAGTDGEIRIWDDRTESEACTLQGHNADIYVLSWRPDGKRLASAGVDLTIRVWDVATAQEVNILRGQAAVRCINWSPGGIQVISVNGKVQLWDATTGKFTKFFPSSNKMATLAYYPNGRLLAGGGRHGDVVVWDPAASEEHPRTLGNHQGYVHSIAWSPDGRRLATASNDMTARIWSLTPDVKPLTLEGHGGWLASVGWSPDGSRVATASNDGSVKVWDADSGKLISTLRSHTGGVLAVAWHPDGQRLASGSNDETVCIMRATPDEPASILRGHEEWVWSVAWSPDGRWLASASDDKKVKVWDTRTNKIVQDLSGHENYVLYVAWHPRGERLASVDYDGMVKIWDAVSGQEAWQFRASQKAVRSIRWSPDGGFLASGGDDAKIRLWDISLTSHSLVREFPGHTAGTQVRALAWSPNGKWLASTGSDRQVILWDPVTGEKRSLPQGHTGSVVALAWSPDSVFLASASFDGVVKIWDPLTQEPIRELRGHSGAVLSLAGNPRFNRLASGGDDIRIWDTATGQQALTLKGHTVLCMEGKHKSNGESLSIPDFCRICCQRLLSY